MKDKYNSIFVDGIDRTGKNLLVKYIHCLSGHRYMAYDRGLLSNMTYARMFGRDVDYDVEQYKPFVFVHLTCDEEDWKIRCKLTNEPPIDYAVHSAEFSKTCKMLKDAGFAVLEANTSHVTPYDLAKQLVADVDELNRQQMTTA